MSDLDAFSIEYVETLVISDGVHNYMISTNWLVSMVLCVRKCGAFFYQDTVLRD
jgi:hypothetical protein